MNTELKQEIANLLSIGIDEILTIQNQHKKALKEETRNLYLFPEFYTEEYIIFTDEQSVKHWEYYVGFEYLEEAPEMLKKGGQFIAAYSIYNDTDERIQDALNIILQAKY